MDDLISRQATIDAVVSYAEEWDRMYIQDLNCRIRDAIKQLPSAEPELPERAEAEWIPCSERLPEKYIGTWLCCCSDGEILILQYDTPGNGDYECKFYYSDDDGYPVIIKDVIAWMPLPEPYKGKNYERRKR